MTKIQIHDATAKFGKELQDLLEEIRKRAVSQFEYNLNTNIPNKIGDITLENSANHALENGLVGAANAMNGWDCGKAIRLAYHIMEDANCHSEAKELVKFIPEYQ